MRNIAPPVWLSTCEHEGIEYTAMSRVTTGSSCAGCCFRVVNGWYMEYCTKPLSFNNPNRCLSDGVIYIKENK